jgi:hypothetical protein
LSRERVVSARDNSTSRRKRTTALGKQKGLFNRSVSDIALKQIQSLNYRIAGIEQTALGFGTIVMQSYLGDIVVHEVHHPEKKKDSIKRLINRLDKKTGVFNKVINYYKIKYLKTLLLVHNEQSLNQRYLLNFHYSKDEN